MEETKFKSGNIPVSVAAQALGVDCQTVRLLLRNNLVSWGFAYKREGSSHFSYIIYPKRFYEETGFICGGE